STSKADPANKWTYVEWKLSDAAQWNAWAGNSNGAITASTAKLDAVWFLHANTSYTVNAYVDDVQLRNCVATPAPRRRGAGGLPAPARESGAGPRKRAKGSPGHGENRGFGACSGSDEEWGHRPRDH